MPCVKLTCNVKFPMHSFPHVFLMQHYPCIQCHAYFIYCSRAIQPWSNPYKNAITHTPTGIVYALIEHIPIGHVPVLTHTLLGLWATNPMEASHQSCAGLRSFTDGLHPNLLSVPLFPKSILTRKSLLMHHSPMPYPTRTNPTHTMPNSHYANPCHAMFTCNQHKSFPFFSFCFHFLCLSMP